MWLEKIDLLTSRQKLPQGVFLKVSYQKRKIIFYII